nr:MAG TPA: hypothetical protein [Caudoviricetes sp.]
MANIIDCENEEIKIGKTSITIKNKETGKTKGIVKNITKFKDIQPNKQIDYFKRLKELNLWRNRIVNMNNVLIQDGEIIVFRNMRSSDFYKQYGFVDNTEKEKHEKENAFYEELSKKIQVIHCYC